MRWLLAVIAVLPVGCGRTAYVTPVGPARPTLAAGCPVNIVREGQPAYPYVDLAKVQVRCWRSQDECLIKLLAATCAAGGDTVYGFAERAQGADWTTTAVVAYRPVQPSEAPAPPPTSPTLGIAP